MCSSSGDGTSSSRFFSFSSRFVVFSSRAVGARGFEPPASCSRSRRSARLSYAPFWFPCGRCFADGGAGFEPALTDSESAVLPLDDPPVWLSEVAGRPSLTEFRRFLLSVSSFGLAERSLPTREGRRWTSYRPSMRGFCLPPPFHRWSRPLDRPLPSGTPRLRTLSDGPGPRVAAFRTLVLSFYGILAIPFRFSAVFSSEFRFVGRLALRWNLSGIVVGKTEPPAWFPGRGVRNLEAFFGFSGHSVPPRSGNVVFKGNLQEPRSAMSGIGPQPAGRRHARLHRLRGAAIFGGRCCIEADHDCAR